MNWSDLQVNEQYRKDMMRQAENYRRVQSARSSHASSPLYRFYRPLVVRIGRQMVSLGSYLVRSQGEPVNEKQAMPRRA